MIRRMSTLILMICMIVTFTGCSLSKNDTQAVDPSTAPAPTPGTDDLILNSDSVIYSYDSGPPQIIIAHSEAEQQMIADIEDYPSEPRITPNGQQLVYISPFEFEMVGEVMLYDAKTREQTKIVSKNNLEDNQSVSFIEWLDDRYLLVATDYAYGTILSSRNLYAYDQQVGSLELLLKLEDNESIKGIRITDNEVILDTIRYTDDQLNDYIEDQQVLDKEALYEQLS